MKKILTLGLVCGSILAVSASFANTSSSDSTKIILNLNPIIKISNLTPVIKLKKNAHGNYSGHATACVYTNAGNNGPYKVSFSGNHDANGEHNLTDGPTNIAFNAEWANNAQDKGADIIKFGQSLNEQGADMKSESCSNMGGKNTTLRIQSPAANVVGKTGTYTATGTVTVTAE